jgi:hypothetical protein
MMTTLQLQHRSYDNNTADWHHGYNNAADDNDNDAGYSNDNDNAVATTTTTTVPRL